MKKAWTISFLVCWTLVFGATRGRTSESSEPDSSLRLVRFSFGNLGGPGGDSESTRHIFSSTLDALKKLGGHALFHPKMADRYVIFGVVPEDKVSDVLSDVGTKAMDGVLESWTSETWERHAFQAQAVDRKLTVHFTFNSRWYWPWRKEVRTSDLQVDALEVFDPDREFALKAPYGCGANAVAQQLLDAHRADLTTADIRSLEGVLRFKPWTFDIRILGDGDGSWSGYKEIYLGRHKKGCPKS